MLESFLADGMIYFGGKARFYFRAVEPGDGLLVARWRNSPAARAGFYITSVVTPGSHADFVATLDPYDCVWMVCLPESGQPIGQLSLHIDPAAAIGEYGRLILSPEHRGGYGVEMDYTMAAVACEMFVRSLLWCEILTAFEGRIRLHDKTGFQRAGVDVPGHTNPRGPVQLMTMDRQQWGARRAAFYELIDVPAPEWLP